MLDRQRESIWVDVGYLLVDLFSHRFECWAVPKVVGVLLVLVAQFADLVLLPPMPEGVFHNDHRAAPYDRQHVLLVVVQVASVSVGY